jgi:hypothetical protein
MADKERDEGGEDEGAASDRALDVSTRDEGAHERPPAERPTGVQEADGPPNAPPHPAPPPEHVARVLSARVQDIIDSRAI